MAWHPSFDASATTLPVQSIARRTLVTACEGSPTRSPTLSHGSASSNGAKSETDAASAPRFEVMGFGIGFGGMNGPCTKRQDRVTGGVSQLFVDRRFGSRHR